MKRCFQCGEEKPIDGFYRDKSRGDGLQARCKTCAAKKNKAYASDNKNRIKEYRKKYNSLPHQKKSQSEWRVMNKKKSRAHHVLHNAIETGVVFVWPVCAIPECDDKPEAHHPDYDRPLDVVWLCRSHHRQAHKSVNKEVSRS